MRQYAAIGAAIVAQSRYPRMELLSTCAARLRVPAPGDGTYPDREPMLSANVHVPVTTIDTR
jgi:hypothetical protein